MMEAGAVIGLDGTVLHWHLPAGRTAGSLPDSHDLWLILWEHRDNLAGFAHSHPGGGVPGPSGTDLSTFSAIEKALGKRLSWWITSSDSLVLVVWVAEDDDSSAGSYEVFRVQDSVWADALRKA